jgi:hypothetical protein
MLGHMQERFGIGCSPEWSGWLFEMIPLSLRCVARQCDCAVDIVLQRKLI